MNVERLHKNSRPPKNSCHIRSYDYEAGRIYNDDEVEFILAVESYKKENRIRFLHITEYLAIAKSLGYVKQDD